MSPRPLLCWSKEISPQTVLGWDGGTGRWPNQAVGSVAWPEAAVGKLVGQMLEQTVLKEGPRAQTGPV